MGNDRQKVLSPTAALTRFTPPPGSVNTIQEAEREERVRYGFRVGDIGLLIDKDTTSEVMEEISIYPIPHLPHWLPGLINLRGSLLPVFNLKLFFGLKLEALEKQWLLILGAGERSVCLFSDGLPRIVVTTRPLEQPPPLPIALRPHVSKSYAYEGIVWSEFNHERFFSSITAQVSAAT